MKFILATKEKMSQIWNESGEVIPVTILQAGPVKITKIRTIEKDGYNAVQLGFGFKKNLNRLAS